MVVGLGGLTVRQVAVGLVASSLQAATNGAAAINARASMRALTIRELGGKGGGLLPHL